MKLKLPRNLQLLTKADRESWQEVQEIFEALEKHYEITSARNPNLKDFHLFADKQKPSFFNSWRLRKDGQSFSLCLIEYETNFQEVGITGASIKPLRHKYFFGHLNAVKDYGRTLIRPETLGDKISELFLPNELDLKGFQKFNWKYYVLAKEKDKFLASTTRELLNFLADQNNLQVEFNGNRCLFRLDKAVNLKETLALAEIGLELERLLRFS